MFWPSHKWCSPFFTHMVHGWATDLSAHSFVICILKNTSSHQATAVRHISVAFQEAKLKPPWDSSPCSSANTAPRQADLRVLDVIWTAPFTTWLLQPLQIPWPALGFSMVLTKSLRWTQGSQRLSTIVQPSWSAGPSKTWWSVSKALRSSCTIRKGPRVMI